MEKDTGTIPSSIVKCKNCGEKCAWVQNVKGKWYLVQLGCDGKIRKTHGMNGMFYSQHSCPQEIRIKLRKERAIAMMKEIIKC